MSPEDLYPDYVRTGLTLEQQKSFLVTQACSTASLVPTQQMPTEPILMTTNNVSDIANDPRRSRTAKMRTTDLSNILPRKDVWWKVNLYNLSVNYKLLKTIRVTDKII